MAGVADTGRRLFRAPHPRIAPPRTCRRFTAQERKVKNTMPRLYRGARKLGNAGRPQLLRRLPRRGHRSQVGQAACWEDCGSTQHALNPEMEATACV